MTVEMETHCREELGIRLELRNGRMRSKRVQERGEKSEKRWRRGGLGVRDQQMQTIVYRVDKQQGPAGQHEELYSISCDKQQQKRIYICVCVCVSNWITLLYSRNEHKYTMKYIVNQLLVIVAQLCLNLGDPMDCTLPGSSVHGTLQARILECVAISFSREINCTSIQF